MDETIYSCQSKAIGADELQAEGMDGNGDMGSKLKKRVAINFKGWMELRHWEDKRWYTKQGSF